MNNRQLNVTHSRRSDDQIQLITQTKLCKQHWLVMRSTINLILAHLDYF